MPSPCRLQGRGPFRDKSHYYSVIACDSPTGEALAFFLNDIPKVLLLLTLIVFVSFSFLIAGPKVGPVGLGLLFGLVGWKITAIYLVLGFWIATIAGWDMGHGADGA